jgi:hypothetical protein
MKKRELDNLLDEVTAGIRSEQIDDAAIKGASDRVWSRMNGTSTMLADSVQEAGPSNRIEGCADFQSLIPAYLGSQLTEARSLLLVDHTHECIPCRKALKNARESRVAVKADRIVKMQTRKRAAVPGYSLRPVVLRWGIAAVLVIGLGLIALPIVERYVPVGSLDATVQAAEGPLYGVADAKTRALNVGEKIGQGDVLRTPKDGRAMVRLQDGTTIEMKDRSEVSLKRTMNGTTLHVDGGSVIVQATKQQQPRRTVFGKLLRTLHLVPQDWGSFYVQTGDSIVAVAGTTFAVNAGTKGSRVSVIEGEVHLDHNGQDKVLRSGEQATTNVAIEAVPVKEDVKWSRNAAQYAQVLDALASLKNELRAVPKPGVRNSTRLLEMMPATTVMYAAIPNLAASITESNRIIEERIQQNPALRDWFANRREPRGPAMNQAIAAIKDFGDQLGEEIAVGAGMSDQGQPTEPIVLAQLKNPGGFRAFFDAEVQKLNTNGKAPQVIWIDDPKTAQPAATTGQGPLYVWITGDVLVGSPKLAQLQAVANGASGFSATPFYSRIAQVYSEGAGIVV